MKWLLIPLGGVMLGLGLSLTACEDAAPPDTDTLNVLKMSIEQAQRHLDEYDSGEQIGNASVFCFRALKQSLESEGQVAEYLQRTCDALDDIEFRYASDCFADVCPGPWVANEDAAYESLGEALSALRMYRNLTGR